MTAVNQLVSILLVNFFALCLTVRSIITSHIWSLIPFDAQPMEALHEFLLCAMDVTFLVSVFNPQDEFASGPPG
jgi:hypothetical protein